MNKPRVSPEVMFEAQRGCRRAEAKIFQSYRDWVYLVQRRRSRSREDAEDLTQETLFGVFRGIDKFKVGHDPNAFIMQQALWVWLKYLNDRKRREKDSPAPAVDTETPDADVLCKEKKERVNLCVDKLNERERHAVRLKDFNGLSNQEIAEQLGITNNAVVALLQRAHRKLAKCFRQLDLGPPGSGEN